MLYYFGTIKNYFFFLWYVFKIFCADDIELVLYTRLPYCEKVIVAEAKLLPILTPYSSSM